MLGNRTSFGRRFHAGAFRYAGLPLLLVTAAIAGLIAYGLYEHAWLGKLDSIPFYKVYLMTFMPVFILFYGVWKLSALLDGRCSWLNSRNRRLVYQLVFAGLLPMALVLSLYLLFLPLFPEWMHFPDFRHAVLLLTAALLLFANLVVPLIYMATMSVWLLSLVKRIREGRKADWLQLALLKKRCLELEEKLERAEKALELDKRELEVYRRLNVETEKTEPVKTDQYKLKTRGKTGLVPYEKIACFFKLGKLIFLQLLDEDFPIPANEKSLKQVESNTGALFRDVTRDFLVARHNIAFCRRKENGKLLLGLKMPQGKELELSKEKSELLEDWILAVVDIEWEHR